VLDGAFLWIFAGQPGGQTTADRVVALRVKAYDLKRAIEKRAFERTRCKCEGTK
jgi:hypothetical protein